MRGEGLNRIRNIRIDPLYIECLSLNALRERDRIFCRHDYRHMLAVSQISYKIIAGTAGLGLFAEKEGLNGTAEAAEVIHAAGLLHDIGRWRQYDTGEDHALVGAGKAGEVLERAGFSKKEIKIITRAIREHRQAGPGTSHLGTVICLADDLSRPCGSCKARQECYKFSDMVNLKEKIQELGIGR